MSMPRSVSRLRAPSEGPIALAYFSNYFPLWMTMSMVVPYYLGQRRETVTPHEYLGMEVLARHPQQLCHGALALSST